MADAVELLKQGKIVEAMQMMKSLQGSSLNISDEERLEAQRQRVEYDVQKFNEGIGMLHTLDGIDCPICKNKGSVASAVLSIGYWSMMLTECSCQNKRRSIRRLQKSGLQSVIKQMRFDNFKTDEPWQKQIYTKAQDFVNGNGGTWFYIGGQVGAGKSHICTAICGTFLEQNRSIKYMPWKDESTKLKALINDEDYSEKIKLYKEVDVLYIDDFLKTQWKDGIGSSPTSADINLAFEILNHRYVNRKTTVISSEWLIDELMSFDEAVASRIHEMSKGSRCQINRDRSRNYRYQH